MNQARPASQRFTANVVSADLDPRIAGYATAADLARFHGLVDVAWLALRGELPSGEQRAALDAALVLLAPVHIGEAPARAASRARMGGARPAATTSAGVTGLAELAELERDELAPWLHWLDAGEGPVPEVARADDASAEWRAAQAALSSRMRDWFGHDRGLPCCPLRRVACAYAILARLGVREPMVLETLTTWARLPAVIAEASHARAGVLHDDSVEDRSPSPRRSPLAEACAARPRSAAMPPRRSLPW